jgi:hypothetical protein
LALPVSIQSFLIRGSATAWNLAQCGQVSEAYSIIVIGASGLPMTRSVSASSVERISAEATAGRFDHGKSPDE